MTVFGISDSLFRSIVGRSTMGLFHAALLGAHGPPALTLGPCSARNIRLAPRLVLYCLSAFSQEAHMAKRSTYRAIAFLSDFFSISHCRRIQVLMGRRPSGEAHSFRTRLLPTRHLL
jgi:hypothetical protein